MLVCGLPNDKSRNRADARLSSRAHADARLTYNVTYYITHYVSTHYVTYYVTNYDLHQFMHTDADAGRRTGALDRGDRTGANPIECPTTAPGILGKRHAQRLQRWWSGVCM